MPPQSGGGGWAGGMMMAHPTDGPKDASEHVCSFCLHLSVIACVSDPLLGPHANLPVGHVTCMLGLCPGPTTGSDARARPSTRYNACQYRVRGPASLLQAARQRELPLPARLTALSSIRRGSRALCALAPCHRHRSLITYAPAFVLWAARCLRTKHSICRCQHFSTVQQTHPSVRQSLRAHPQPYRQRSIYIVAVSSGSRGTPRGRSLHQKFKHCGMGKSSHCLIWEDGPALGHPSC